MTSLFRGDGLEGWLRTRRTEALDEVRHGRRSAEGAVAGHSAVPLELGRAEPRAVPEVDMVTFTLSIPFAGDAPLLTHQPEGFNPAAVELVEGTGVASAEVPQGTVGPQEIVLTTDVDPTDADVEAALQEWCDTQMEALTRVVAYVNVEADKHNQTLRDEIAQYEADVKLASDTAESINITMRDDS